VQILNSVVRHFGTGIECFSNGTNLLVEDTIASDNATGISGADKASSVKATLNRITANNNFQFGVETSANTTITNSVLSNNGRGLQNAFAVTWLAKTVISGNATGVLVAGTVNSYGDNYIRDNTTPVTGSLTPVTTQ
jgi:hypothetical protein